MSHQAEIRERVTNRIIDALQAGTAPWRRPWSLNAGSPANVISRKSYRGINTLLLNCQPYASRWYGTYQQWQSIGGQVRRGEHGARIVFWKPVEKITRNDNGEVEEDKYVVLREYTVFNAEQCDGTSISKFRADQNEAAFTDHDLAEEVIAATGADIRFGGDRAVYVRDEDFIRLPPKQSFPDQHEFYATAFHELAHWTGHMSRLDRLNENARFGDAAYAFEELVAEIGGSFLCSEIGIPQSSDMSNHYAYLGHWLKVLEQDHGAILRASSQASKAADFILAFGRQEPQSSQVLVAG